ncbi:unnamed protein product [Microthlaspi erraticum]|uniref:F-box domain-containing protein n=1 Tax=Microthlaspi erraticum TaxID=1685480 RepID=A0A6D2IZ95_9BRAS|nr:unnamed protein product [Microthlaspi erraticum]
MAESARKEHMLSMPDWSHLPEELLHIISKNLENCFDVVHARSVCRSWRSNFPFPACLSRQSYSLPTFLTYYPKEDGDLCTLEKIPLFVFTVHNPTSSVSEYLLGGIVGDEPGDDEELPSRLQSSVNLKMPYTNLINVLDCHILSLGHQYRIKHISTRRDFQGPTVYGGVAFIQLNKEGGGDFMVLLNDVNGLMLLTSAEMRWKRLKNVPSGTCMDIVSFRGKFYATFLLRETFVIDPYTMDVTTLMPLQDEISNNYLVRCGDDELFLVELTYPMISDDVVDPKFYTCRVSRLDEEAGRWVEVRDLGDRVFFIGYRGNFSCLAKDLCDGRVSGNSVLITNMCMDLPFFFKYGLRMGSVEEDLESYLSVSLENRVTIVYNTYPVLALLVQ